MHWNALALCSIALLILAGCSNTSDHTSAESSPSHTTITVHVDQPGPKINPAMWGAFFEDINFGADGGLYAEMVKNRSFEFPDSMMGWIKVVPSLAHGAITIETDSPFRETNPHYARITSTANQPMGVSNEGFRGMGVRAGDTYNFSTQIRGIDGSPIVTVELVGADGTTLAVVPLTGISSTWQKITATLRPNDTDAHARLAVFVQGHGTIDLDMVSLFPEKTWKNRPAGLRADMVQLLADLHPGFLRFPGGCIVEGSDLSKRYQWKNTIGPIEDRKLLIDRWNYEFKHRPTPDYFQSFGLGFYEYFQLCEDIGAQPLPLVNCGMACQFNSGELCPIDALGPYIQDALDLIEFANGPATGTWGAKRAAMGHPAPFNLKMIGVGNEQWGPQYIERLKLFTQAIKKDHPEISIISAAGPSPEDERFQFLWPKLCDLKADIVDQHCYANPIWFLANSDRYDHYDRTGPKVFFGEYAAQSVAIVSTKNRNNLECALAEAAYMTGLERNADVVSLASYAPLFANVDAWQWTPDMIWVDSLRVLPTPNYYVQKMYATNRGDTVLPVTNTAPIHDILPAGRIGVGTSDASAEFKDVQISLRVPSHTTLLPDLSSAPTTPGDGNWKTIDGVCRQSNIHGNTGKFVGDVSWSNYTLSLSARKLSGTGPLVITICDDGKGSRAQWILGGWENQQHGIMTHYAEQDQLLNRTPGSLENDRWYKIKVTINGDQMDCYLDDKLVQSARVLHHRVPTLFTTAAKDESTGETILKVINAENEPTDATIKLEGAAAILPTAHSITLSGNPSDENSFDKPSNVAPVSTQITGVNSEFTRTFPAHSFTVLRIGTSNSTTK